MKSTSIYALCDPRVSPVEWRYVGKTVRDVTIRLKEHVYFAEHDPISPVQFWTRKLLQEGVEPSLMVLEVVLLGGDWEEAERRWIKVFRLVGYHLLNLTDGGDGTEGYEFTEEDRQKLRRPKTEEHKRKIGDGNRGTVRLDMVGENNPTHPVNIMKREDPEGYKGMCEAASRRMKGVPRPLLSGENAPMNKMRRNDPEKYWKMCRDRGPNISIGVSKACARRGHDDMSRAGKLGWVTRRAKKAAREAAQALDPNINHNDHQVVQLP